MSKEPGNRVWIRSTVAGLFGIVVGLLAGGWGFLLTGWAPFLVEDVFGRSPGAEGKTDPPLFFRVFAQVEFDGEPVIFDEILRCDGPSADGLGRRLRDGGALFMSAPQPCNTAKRLLRKMKQGRKGGRRLEEIQIPKNYLPYFFWADNADNPKVMEGYVSEIYFKQPYTRLKIKNVDIGPFTWRVPDGRQVLDDALYDQDPLNIFTLRYHPRFRGDHRRAINWTGHALFPIREDEWRTSPTLVAALEGIGPEHGLYNVPEAVREAGMTDISWQASSEGRSSMSAANRLQSMIRKGVGLPRYGGDIHIGIGADDPGHGVLGGPMIDKKLFFALRRVEEVVPMDCVGNRCEVLEDRRGYYRFKPDPVGAPDQVDTIVYQGVEIGVEYGAGLFYDPKTRVLWLVADETI